MEGGNDSHQDTRAPDPAVSSDPAVHSDPTVSSDPAVLAEWIDRARSDDPKAWSLLYRHHYEDVHRQVLYLQGDAAIAEDLVQETFVRAMRGIGGYRGEAAFSTWLHRIAINVVRRHWRRTSVRQRTVEGFARVSGQRPVPSPEDLHTEKSRARALLSALDQLAPALREAFVLRDLLGVPSSEAAATLGISPGHLAVRGHRARAKLKDILTSHGWTDDK